MKRNYYLYKLYVLAPRKFKKKVVKLILKLEGGQMYSSTIRAIYKKEFKIEIGYGTYGGCFNLQNVPSGVKIGNYCSIARNIRIFRANHPKGRFTTHPILYNPVAGFVKSDCLERPALIIGHDVWIGEWAIILPGVKRIGTGSIIGAGSVVTNDVEPYSIVAGNPARIIGQRFTKEIIDKLQETQWWNCHLEGLIKKIELLDKIIKSCETESINE